MTNIFLDSVVDLGSMLCTKKFTVQWKVGDKIFIWQRELCRYVFKNHGLNLWSVCVLCTISKYLSGIQMWRNAVIFLWGFRWSCFGGLFHSFILSPSSRSAVCAVTVLSYFFLSLFSIVLRNYSWYTVEKSWIFPTGLDIAHNTI